MSAIRGTTPASLEEEHIMGGFDFQALIEMAKAIMPIVMQIISMFK